MTAKKHDKPAKLTSEQKRLLAHGLLVSYLGLHPEWPEDKFDHEMRLMIRVINKACKQVGM